LRPSSFAAKQAESAACRAAQPRQQIAGPHGIAEQACDLLQQLVAGGMAAGVVDDLELVEVDVHECVHGLAVRGVRQGLAQPGLELLAVVQAGQRIVRGTEAHLDAESALLGDVMEHQHGAQQRAVGIADRRSGILDAVFAAIPRQQQGLGREPDHAALEEAGHDRIPRRLAGLLVHDPEHLGRGQPLRLVARPAGQALRHGIQPGHMALDVGGDHRVTDRLQGDLQQFAFSPQVGLGEALRRHVPVDADEARRSAIVRLHRAERGAQVANAPIRPDHAELDAGRRLAGHHAAHLRHQRRTVPGMQPFDPIGIGHGLTGGRAAILTEHPVIPVRLIGAGIDVPDAEMAGVDGERHALASILDGETLGALGGDVLERPDEPDHPIPLEDGPADRSRPEAGAIPAAQGQFEIPRPPLAEARFDGDAHGVAGLGRVETDGLVDGRHEVVGHAVQSPRLLCPVQSAAGEVERPAANADHLADAVEQGLAATQGGLVGLAGRDVALDGHVALDAPIGGEQGLDLEVGPVPAAVLVAVEDLDATALAAAQRGADRRDRGRVRLRDLQHGARLAADDVVRRVPADPGEPVVDPRRPPLGIRDDHRVRGEAHHLRQASELGGGAGGVAAVALPALHDPHRRFGQRGERFALAVVEAARHAVDHAQGADARAVGEDQRHAGMEAERGRAGGEGVIGEAGIAHRVLDLEQSLAQQRMGAKGKLAGGFLHALQSAVGLEPLPIRIDQAHEGDRRAANGRSGADHRIQLRLRRRVQHAERAQSS